MKSTFAQKEVILDARTLKKVGDNFFKKNQKRTSDSFSTINTQTIF